MQDAAVSQDTTFSLFKYFNSTAKTKNLSPLLSTPFPDFSPVGNSNLMLGYLLHSYLMTLILNN